MSSEPGVVSPYAFNQLDAPPSRGEITDALSLIQWEANALRESARSEGHAEGYAAGLAQARAEAAGPLAAAAQMAGELARMRERLVDELEREALGLAFDLAEQILAGALEVQPERVLDVARHALRHITDRRQVTLIVNPDDLPLLTECAVELQAQLGGIEHLAVQADRRVGRGGAVARTEAGEIDAGISVQLSRARELVSSALAVELPAPAGLVDETAEVGAPVDEVIDAEAIQPSPPTFPSPAPDAG